MKKVAFCGGAVFSSVSEQFVSCNVLCEDGYIVSLTKDTVPLDYEIVDIEGKYLIPGLIDVHTHGLGGYDFNTADEQDLSVMAVKYAKEGTTSLMATLASATISSYMNSIFAINQARLFHKPNCAHILGVHLEGRYLSPNNRGCHAPELLAKPNLKELASLSSAMMPPPLHFSIAPELDGAHEFIKKAIELGATVGIAHTVATYEEAVEAVKLGATSFTHTFNAMTKIHHRMPGASIASLTCNDAYTEIICDGEHIHPAMVRLAYQSKPSDKLVLITDSMMATSSPDGEYEIAGTKVFVQNGRATDESGTLAGSTLTMFKALKNMMKFCGISLCEALKFATINPANMVKADFVGKIAKRYRADFLVLDQTENPTIEEVYISGNKVN